jgi:adenylate cyclase
VNFQKGQRQKWIGTLIGVVLTVGCGLVFSWFTVGSGLTRWSYDLFLVQARQNQPPPNQAVLVYMDIPSYDRLHQPLNAPWDRALHAALIDRLTAAGAKAIVFDIVFSGSNFVSQSGGSVHVGDGDALLATAMHKSGRVVLGAERVSAAGGATRMNTPIDLLRDAAAGMGSVEVIVDRDLTVRRHTPEEELPSLSQVAAEFLLGEGKVLDRVADQSCWLNYYGPADALPWASYYEALDPSVVPDSWFKNKTVFVGARLITKLAGERKDEYLSPFSYWTPDQPFISGVEIQATAFLNWYRGEWLIRWPRRAERLVLVVLGLIFGIGLVQFRPLSATGLAAGGVVLIAVSFYALFRQKLIWFPWLIGVAQVGTAFGWSVLFNSVQLYVQKRMIEQTLGLYLSPKLVRKFSGNPRLLKPGAEEQTITIFFSDIADFTAISQRLPSDQLAELMNRYFQTAVAECVHPTDGTVVKYIGDAVFAFWNAPEQQPDHRLLACEAALRLQEHPVFTPAGEPLLTRIGIHTGPARVGNFGSDDRVDYTALGESVNLASRLEGLNKFLGTNCLITRDTWEGVGEAFLVRPVGFFRLKGFEKPVEVFELMGRPDQEEPTRAWRETFAQALTNYQERNLEFAAAGFREVLERRPQDGPSLFYLNRLQELQTQDLPEEWATYTILKEK